MIAQKILFATDYSESSIHALSLATSLARESGGLLLIAHVDELFEEEPQDNPAALAKLKAVIPTDATVRYEHRLLCGEPGRAGITKAASVIANLAEKEHVDLIVLGTHGRSGVSRVLMGSVAEAVLHKARCAVIVLKQPATP